MWQSLVCPMRCAGFRENNAKKTNIRKASQSNKSKNAKLGNLS